MNVRKEFLAILFSILAIMAFSTPASAATPEEVENSIQNGTAWLAATQNPDGSWGDSSTIATSGLVLYKLIDRAYELDKDPLEVCGDPVSPTCYEYAQNVVEGLDFVMANVQTVNNPALQDHTLLPGSGTWDDPDTNGNDIALYWQSDYCSTIPGPCSDRQSYTTGIMTAMLSLLDGTELVTAGPYTGTTYAVITQDAVDWLAYAQSDLGPNEGAWEYSGSNNTGGGDNSVSGYAVLGLASAEAAGYTVPDWVKAELNLWINYIQNTANGVWCDNQDTGDCIGGPGYWEPNSWVNILKTGNLIQEMTLFGDPNTQPRLVNATNYIERHFYDTNIDPGWGYTMITADYQAMFTTMKGFEYAGIDLIALDGDSIADDDWWMIFADTIVAQEIPGLEPDQGYWKGCNWGTDHLCTAWALLTLEKTAPPSPMIEVYFDVKPGSCPNPINPGKKGVTPVAILGTEEFDVTTIDPETVQLTLEGMDVGVAPLRSDYEDVATPFDPVDDACCHDLNGDGFMDMTLKFDTPTLVETLGLTYSGEMIQLQVVGNLNEESGGTSIMGEDCVLILDK